MRKPIQPFIDVQKRRKTKNGRPTCDLRVFLSHLKKYRPLKKTLADLFLFLSSDISHPYLPPVEQEIFSVEKQMVA